MKKKLRKSLSIVLTITFVLSILAISPGILGAQTAQAIPGKIEAESYVTVSGLTGGPTESCSDEGGGLNVGWTAAGAYMTYLVDVAQAGTYMVAFRMSGSETAAMPGAFSLKKGSPIGEVLCTVDMKGTGGWQNWQTFYSYVDLTAGEQTLVFYCNRSGFNINWMSFLSETVAAKPTASPGAGTYRLGSAIGVMLASITPGAQIYYTTDGSDPTEASTLYTEPIDVSTDTTIKAIGVKAGLDNSAVATFEYVFVVVPFLSSEEDIPALIAYMTLAEKASLLGGISAGNRVSGAAGGTQHNLLEKYGIPGTSLPDGPAGVRISRGPFTGPQGTFYRNATQLPNATGRAATWNTELLQEIGAVVGRELVFFGSDLLLAPGMNLHRHPLNGRGFEYYSEDPVLSGKAAAAETIGVQSEGGGVTLKHFTANNQETSRSNLPTNIDIRALRELYLRHFEIAVKEGKPRAIMTAYNQVNGYSPPQNPELLKKIVREEWGFDGIFMTDWGGIGDSSYWKTWPGYTPTSHASGVKAGLNLCMSSGNAANIVKGVDAGFISMDEIDYVVRDFLKYILKTPIFNGSLASTTNNPYVAQNEAVCFEASAEGIVLLKNETVSGKPSLPITTGKVALIGNATNNLVRGGTGSGNVNVDTSRLVHLEAALKAVYGANNVLVNTSATPTVATLTALIDQVENVVLTIRRTSGEGSDISVSTYNLSSSEASIINNASQICHNQGKPFIVVLNVGSPMEIASWRDKADAILITWQPGIVLGKPIAAVLIGNRNPSGKLSQTWPIHVSGTDANGLPWVPSVTFKSKPVTYTEGIYMGYRYYDTFNVATAYEFGYGLSYTTFEYSNLQVLPRKFEDKATVKVDIINTGNVAGKEAVQLYLKAPATKMDKPFQELKAFAKTKMLELGETQTLTLEIDKKSLASFDPVTSAWVAEAGNYEVRIGASSKDIRQRGFFKLDNDLVVEEVNNVLLPVVQINLMKPVSLSSMITLVNDYIASGDIKGPLVVQSTNKLKQLEQQINVGDLGAAVLKLEEFLGQINNPDMAANISIAAKEKLNADAQVLIRIWTSLISSVPMWSESSVGGEIEEVNSHLSSE